MFTSLLSQVKSCVSGWFMMIWFFLVETHPFAAGRVRRHGQRSRRTFPRSVLLECCTLEDRCLPAMFIWIGDGTNPNWNVAENWEKNGPGGDYPGHADLGDWVTFAGTRSNNPVILNIALPNNTNP